MAAVITLAALTGLRRGELCGLRWSDIDWPGSMVIVRRSIWQVGSDRGCKDTKDPSDSRLAFGGDTAAVLRGRWHRAIAAADIGEVTMNPDCLRVLTGCSRRTPRHAELDHTGLLSAFRPHGDWRQKRDRQGLNRGPIASTTCGTTRPPSSFEPVTVPGPSPTAWGTQTLR